MEVIKTDTEFKVTKDNLNRKSGTVKTLHIENEYYKVTIYYYGEYMSDVIQHDLKPDLVSVSCKCKNPDVFELQKIENRIIIDCSVINLIDPTETTKITKMLKITEKSANSLQQTLNNLFYAYTKKGHENA